MGQPGLTLIATVLAIGFATMLYGVLEVATSFVVKNLPRQYDKLTADVDRVASDRQLDVVG